MNNTEDKGDMKILNADEVAEILCCSKETVYRMARAGTIPHFHIGSMLRFSMQQIENWIKGK